MLYTIYNMLPCTTISIHIQVYAMLVICGISPVYDIGGTGR